MSNTGSTSSSMSPSPPPEAPPNGEKVEVVNGKKKGEAPETAVEQGEEGNERKSESRETSPTPEESVVYGDVDDNNASESLPSPPIEKESSEPTTSTDQPDDAPAQPVVANAHVQGDWQAIWSPQHGMYYFYNMRTNETTWTNPLAPPEAGASSAMPSSSRLSVEEAAAAAGIDPALAYLDPTLLAGPSAPTPFAYTAKFNARTGAFAKPDARNPEHVSEYERMRRMNSFYFDMDAWQQEVEKREEEEEAGKKRKKLTKKDLEAFKERKRQKKLAKTAWLRT